METVWRPVPREGFTERSTGRMEFKVGGLPCWLQDPQRHVCACGAEMAFLCEIPECTEFARRPGRADQRHDSYGESYVLLLGNAVHLLACPEHCHPAAVWPVPQN